MHGRISVHVFGGVSLISLFGNKWKVLIGVFVTFAWRKNIFLGIFTVKTIERNYLSVEERETANPIVCLTRVVKEGTVIVRKELKYVIDIA